MLTFTEIHLLMMIVITISGAQESLNEKVQLKPCETYDLSRVQTPSDYQSIANSSEALEGIESCMKVWIKQIEQVKLF